MSRGTRETRRFGDHDVDLTNLDKSMFPDDGIVKRDIVEYVIRCADPLLAALRDRPLSMERRIDGLRKPGFFHKHKPEHFPDWVSTTETPTSKGPMEQVVVDDLATLVLVTNFGCLTPHVPITTVSDPDHPDQLVVDLDPSTDDLQRIRDAAHLVRELLDDTDLPSFPRWSGSRGIHLVVPLDRTADLATVSSVSQQLAETLCARYPALFTLAFRKMDRGDRIYVDVARNHPGATIVASWAIRARPGAPVAMPVGWDEVDDTFPQAFTLRTAPDRLSLDPWAEFEGARVDITRASFG
ncbi:MAG: non-homologous end-joining DNA ligase [Myxococcota bacterium]